MFRIHLLNIPLIYLQTRETDGNGINNFVFIQTNAHGTTDSSSWKRSLDITAPKSPNNDDFRSNDATNLFRISKSNRNLLRYIQVVHFHY